MTEKLKLAEDEFKLKNFTRALELYYQLEEEEDDNQLHIKQQQGICLIELGEYEKSIAANLELIKMADFNPIGYLNVAVALFRQKKSIEAISFLENTLKSEINFSDEDRKMLKQLKFELTGRIVFGEPNEQIDEDYDED